MKMVVKRGIEKASLSTAILKSKVKQDSSCMAVSILIKSLFLLTITLNYKL